MTNQINDSFKKMLSEVEQQSVLLHSSNLGVDPNWLLAVMYFETAGTLSPSKKNHIGSVGLIQFTRDSGADNGNPKQYKTINGTKYYLDSISKMSFVQQMELVELYLTPYKSKIKSYLDLYLAVFFPLAMSKSDDFVLKTNQLSASIIAKQNPIFDSNQDKQITRKEVTDYFKKYFDSKFGSGFFNKNINNSKKKIGLVISILLIIIIILSYIKIKRK